MAGHERHERRADELARRSGRVARSIGRVDPMRMVLDPSDSRPMNTDSPTLGLPSGHSHCAGDATARLSTNSDLVLRRRRRRPQPASGGTRLISGGTEIGGGAQSWFSLWTDRTSIDLHAAGGSLTPISTQHVDGTNAFPLMFNSGLMGDSFLSVPLQCGRIGRQHLLRSPEGYGRRRGPSRRVPTAGGTVRRPFAQRRRHADRNGRGPRRHADARAARLSRRMECRRGHPEDQRHRASRRLVRFRARQ